MVGSAQAQRAQVGSATSGALETEHLFGFTTGSDIGRPGEAEVEVTSVGRFDRQAERYGVVSTELEYKYPLSGAFRVSGAATVSYFGISGATGLDDRSQVVFDNISLELAYRILDRRQAPVGLTIIASPFLAFVDDAGAAATQAGASFVLAADRELTPGLFGAVNLVYGFESSRDRVTEGAADSSGLGFQLAASHRIASWLYIGAEARYLRSYAGAGLNAFSGQALYVGPVFYAPLGKGVSLSGAWNIQAWGQSTGAAGGLDLQNFERQQVLLRLEVDF